MADLPKRITFNRPALLGRELDYIRQSVETMHTSGDGSFTRRCAALLRDALGVPEVFLTPSCTDALEMSAILLDLAPGDEVIVPAFSFVSTVNAFVLRGARPVFADVRRDTLNLDESRLEALICDRTRAIVVVHYAGVACEMDEILEIAERHGIPVVEDNAHGLFGQYRGRYLGSLGLLAAQSFHETKNFSCGEGGALLVNDAALVERAEIVRDKGTNRQQLFRGQVDKYTWVDIGSSFGLSDILAAFLCAQLEQRDRIMSKRKALWDDYHAAFDSWATDHGIGVPHVPPHCRQAYHMYYLMLPSLEARQNLIARLKQQRIDAVFHFTPLHRSRMGQRFGGESADCPVTEWAGERLLRLPFHDHLTSDDQQRVVDEVKRAVDP